MRAKQFFVSGIGTEVGKTVISSILVTALKADYWKPVQAGDLEHSDSMKVANWSGAAAGQIFEEGFRLNTPASPHWAAEIDGVELSVNDFHLPSTQNHLIVEGAGGLMVPLNDKECVIDLIKALEIPVILVSRNYLGSINHSLLSIEALKTRAIPIAGIIFNGPSTPSTQDYILQYAEISNWLHVEEAKLGVNQQFVHETAAKLEDFVNNLLLD